MCLYLALQEYSLFFSMPIAPEGERPNIIPGSSLPCCDLIGLSQT